MVEGPVLLVRPTWVRSLADVTPLLSCCQGKSHTGIETAVTFLVACPTTVEFREQKSDKAAKIVTYFYNDKSVLQPDSKQIGEESQLLTWRKQLVIDSQTQTLKPEIHFASLVADCNPKGTRLIDICSFRQLRYHRVFGSSIAAAQCRTG